MHYHATSFDTDTIKIGKLVFNNSTISCDGEVVDTNEKVFRVELQKALAERIEEYVSGDGFLDTFNEALELVQLLTREHGRPLNGGFAFLYAVFHTL